MNNSAPQTLVELLKASVRKRSTTEIMRFRESKVWVGLTGDELMRRVRHVALGLYDLGVRKGDRVAMLAESGPLWSISDYGILSNGAVNVPIYPTQALYQIEYILRESSPQLLFISTARQMRRVESVLEKFPDLRIVSFQPMVDDENVMNFSELEKRGSMIDLEQPELYDLISSEVGPADLASIIYTSGTTGEPKGAMLTHSNIAFNAVASGAFLSIESGGVMLSFLPLSHIFERMVLYLCTHRGVQINYAGGIETVAGDMLEVHPTLMSTVPRLLEKIYARMQKNASEGGALKKGIFNWAVGVARRSAALHTSNTPLPPLLEFQRDVADRLVFTKLRNALGGKIRRMVAGGAAMPPDIAMVFLGAGIPVLQGYGLTETSPVIAVNTLDANRIGSVGRPLSGVEVKIAADGEILTRGAHVFSGYFNKDDETAAAFTDEAAETRWFKTGDVGYIDGDGFLFITDRKKDLIKTSLGKYVAPQMIENLINQSEYVEQSVIVGDKRKYVSALIVPDFERLRAWCRHEGIDGAGDKEQLIEDRRVVDLFKNEIQTRTRDLADYEKVKRVALLSREFTIDGGELTPTLKVRRRVVEEKYRALIESLYPGGE
jgi:long-chain acyl-CoA synthetase